MHSFDLLNFIAVKFNNGEFDYWLVVNFINWEEVSGEKKPKYVVEIKAVSPQQAGKKNLKDAFESFGVEDEKEIKKADDEKKVYILSEYGISARVYSAEGDNADKLLEEAKKQVPLITGMFGFYMDSPQNRMGNTGWDFIKGDIGFK